jgi:succinate dehydrogenase/fumarate reductase flavoprotein subunit
MLELDADLAVVGFGAAGAAAALTAAAAGAEVLLLEKQREDEHTPNTRMSGGVIMAVNDAEGATRYLDRCGAGMLPEAVSRAWAERAARLIRWLDEIGAGKELELVRIGGAEQRFEGAEAIDCYMQGLPSGERIVSEETTALLAAGLGKGDPNRRTGRDLYAVLKRLVAERTGIAVRWGFAARRLLADGDGRIVGVEVETDEGPARVNAPAGVVLASGGYEFDEELKRNHLKADPIYFYGNPANTGDGVRMAQAVGADLWHMNQMVGRAVGRFVDEDGGEHIFQIRISPPGYVITDKWGRRFASEEPQALLNHGYYYHLIGYDPEAREYPRIPCYWFFDRRRLEAGILTSPVSGRVGVGMYSWSADNSVEIARGWIAHGDTVAEAAAGAGVLDPAAAEAEVRFYNGLCENRVEDPFGRPAETMIPLDQPPYFCVPLYPGGSNTSGGPRRDKHGRAIDVEGRPIRGLFCAGELGSPLALLYPADGANLSEAFCFGQIAAESALAAARPAAA